MDPITRLTLITVLLFMARGMTGPLSSLYWRSLGASYLVIGLLGTVTSVTTIGASALWGRASDRRGRRGFLVGGLAALAAGFGLVAMAPGAGALFPIYALTAAAQAAYDTASLALMGDWLEHRAHAAGATRGDGGLRMGTYRGLASLGFGVMAFVSGGLADRLSLRAPFALAAGIYSVAVVLAWAVREPPAVAQSEALSRESGRDGAGAARPSAAQASRWRVREQRTRSGRSRYGEADAPRGQGGLPRLPLAPLLVAALLWSLVTGAVYAVWGNYMVDELGYAPAEMTRLWALASLAEFPLMIAAGALSDRLGRLPMLTLGFVAWGLVFSGYLVAPVMPWIVVVQLIRGFAYSAHTATTMIYAAEVRERAERGRVSGLLGTAGALGAILGSSLGGAVTEIVGFRALIGAAAAVIFAGAVYLAGAALAFVRARRGRAPIPSAGQ